MTEKSNFYLSVLYALKTSTNLSKIQKDLSISKQKLNFYLRQLKKEGYIIQKGRGWYEVTDKSKNMSNHDRLLRPDISRGHAYVWKVQIPKIPNWENRIQVLKDKNVHFNLVGGLKTTPRIKILGRKIWLCNDNIRVYDKPKESYYGQTAKESRQLALNEIKLIVGVLEKKLGIIIKPEHISFQKEHYALIKNDLAIEHNRKGEIIRISDKDGEWLLIDDSLEEGGELENVGKKAFQTNIPMQKWWNEQKETKFEVTPKFLLQSINQVTENQKMFARNIEEHMAVLKDMRNTLKIIRKSLSKDKAGL